MDKPKKKQNLPEGKKQELKSIVELVLSHSKYKVHFIILFGSHARGDWVEDSYVEEGITYSYQSDFDLLVIIEEDHMRKQQKFEDDLEQLIDDNNHIFTPVSFLVHDLKTINQKLSQRQYFFADIKREGIILHDSGEHKLVRLEQLAPDVRYQLAIENFEYWFSSAIGFYKQYKFALKENELAISAFLLHQETERLYHAILLVYTHYKPKVHDLKKLRKFTNSLDTRLIQAFPLLTKQDKHLFKLLRRAYIDSRYNKEYRITHSELLALQEQVVTLQQLTEKLCKEKIEHFRECVK